MPELTEQMYCSQQIVIPPKFPYILKRYCKAAIKTQPYDLLRWSFEYFKALSQRKPPPVKLRLEYPIYSTEGGLTRGCLKVLAQQLSGMTVVPLSTARAAWQGFCLDPMEYVRILCLCEVHLRADQVPYLHFIAVAAGLLTKTLTYTMILLCETLTKEPDGGSAAIRVEDFLEMYRFLAEMDASKDVKYINGYREGQEPPPEPEVEEEEIPEPTIISEDFDVDFWGPQRPDLQRLPLINDHVAREATISERLNMPVLGAIERSPSAERAARIERETYLRERREKPAASDDVDAKLRAISTSKARLDDSKREDTVGKTKEEPEVPQSDGTHGIDINVFDENSKPVPYTFYGQPIEVIKEIDEEENMYDAPVESEKTIIEEQIEKEPDPIQIYVAAALQDREARREDLQKTFLEIAQIVDRFNSANYDLGMVAGRQMSTTSGDFIVAQLEREIMEYVDEQIAILPDPDLKKKKAKPEEVAMIRQILEQFLDENMELIMPELEEAEEEEEPIPDIIQVYAVPGIGPAVDDDIIRDLEDYALDVSKVQADLFMPRNIRHFMCPPLEKYEEFKFEEDVKCNKEDGIPVGGTITQ